MNFTYNSFRKDAILATICIYITLIGLLVIIIKRLILRGIVQRIPKSNILPRPTNDQEQSFEMATLHSTPRIIKVELTKTNLTLLNNSKLIKSSLNWFDLSSIAKGYAVQLIHEYLMLNNMPTHLIDIGGELIINGTINNQPCKLGLQNS